MKNVLTMALLIGSATLLFSCGGEKHDTPPPPPPPQVCTWTADHSGVKTYWTAYKHTAKAPVKGEFESVTGQGNASAETPAGLLDGASFNIDAMSSNSGDTVRDMKVRDFWFGLMAEPGQISGKFSAVTTGATGTDGGAKVTVRMNGVDHAYDATWVIEDDIMKIRTTLMITDYNAEASVKMIAEKCAEKHTGTDGAKKMWDDFAVMAEVPVKKECK